MGDLHRRPSKGLNLADQPQIVIRFLLASRSMLQIAEVKISVGNLFNLTTLENNVRD